MTAQPVTSTYEVLGVQITATNLNDATSTILSWTMDRKGRFICLRDVASLMAIKDDPAIRYIHNEAAMVLPDGGPIALVGKLQGWAVTRTSGPDLLDEVCRRSVEIGARHFFYGGKEGVAAKLAEVLKVRYPGIQIAGSFSPPFGEISEKEHLDIIRMLNASDAHVIWVGISSPKQDVWMAENYSRINSTLIGVGAAFDFHTGSVRRAPRWMQRIMLEWLFRLLSEPKRLWRRYLILAPRFVMEVIVTSLSRKLDKV